MRRRPAVRRTPRMARSLVGLALRRRPGRGQEAPEAAAYRSGRRACARTPPPGPRRAPPPGRARRPRPRARRGQRRARRDEKTMTPSSTTSGGRRTRFTRPSSVAIACRRHRRLSEWLGQGQDGRARLYLAHRPVADRRRRRPILSPRPGRAPRACPSPVAQPDRRSRASGSGARRPNASRRSTPSRVGPPASTSSPSMAPSSLDGTPSMSGAGAGKVAAAQRPGFELSRLSPTARQGVRMAEPAGGARA